MGKETARYVRDELNKMIDALNGSSQEEHIVRCCLAVSIEELEKWIYNGEFTPTVKPIREGREFGEPLTEKFPTIQKMLNKKKPLDDGDNSQLDSRFSDEEIIKRKKERDARKGGSFSTPVVATPVSSSPLKDKKSGIKAAFGLSVCDREGHKWNRYKERGRYAHYICLECDVEGIAVRSQATKDFPSEPTRLI